MFIYIQSVALSGIKLYTYCGTRHARHWCRNNTHTYARTRARTHTHLHTHSRAHTRTHTHTRAHTHTHVKAETMTAPCSPGQVQIYSEPGLKPSCNLKLRKNFFNAGLSSVTEFRHVTIIDIYVHDCSQILSLQHFQTERCTFKTKRLENR
jgi:hypothetical protein